MRILYSNQAKLITNRIVPTSPSTLRQATTNTEILNTGPRNLGPQKLGPAKFPIFVPSKNIELALA